MRPVALAAIPYGKSWGSSKTDHETKTSLNRRDEVEVCVLYVLHLVTWILGELGYPYWPGGLV